LREPAPLSIPPSVDALQELLAGEQYIAERGLAVPVYLALRLKRPLFSRARQGVGKTEVAKVLASALKTTLIRLQCYEGSGRQPGRLRVELSTAAAGDPHDRNGPFAKLGASAGSSIAPRPRASCSPKRSHQAAAPARHRGTRQRPPVLLIDEIDRADEEFEGYLLEFLSDFQVTIPELDTIRASEPPVVSSLRTAPAKCTMH
jgi:MoxR-like ATPase